MSLSSPCRWRLGPRTVLSCASKAPDISSWQMALPCVAWGAAVRGFDFLKPLVLGYLLVSLG